MDYFLQQLINGLSVGSIYALIAVGYSLVYSIMNFSNFAHGSVIMLAAYMGFFALGAFGVNRETIASFDGGTLALIALATIAIAAIGAGLVAVGIERIAYDSLRRRKAPFLFFIISAMGISMMIDNMVVATLTATAKPYPLLVDRIFGSNTLSFGALSIGWLDFSMLLVSAACLTLLIFVVDFTKVGKAIQAAAYNIKAASLMGVSASKIIMLVFFMAGALAGVAGVFYGFKYNVNPLISNFTIKAFIAAVFGGLGSLPGAVLGAILLGLIEVTVSAVGFSTMRDLVAFGILVAMLVFRPSGIMGKVVEDKA